MSSLAEFFDTMGPFLRGETTVAEVEAVLGRSPSPAKDLEFYPWLVDYGWVKTLGELFPTVQALADRQPDLGWATLARRYLRDHPPTGWELQAMGEHLADWLAEQPDLPAAWSCVGDYRWTRWLARSAPDVDGPGLDVRVFLRHYPVDVVEIVRTVHAHPDTDLPGALPAGQVIVIYRHVRDRDVRTFVPTTRAMAVLAELGGYGLSGQLAAFDATEREQERRTLRTWGVIP